MDEKQRKFLATLIRWNPEYVLIGNSGFWKLFLYVILILAALTGFCFGIGHLWGDRAFWVAVRISCFLGGITLLGLFIYSFMIVDEVADHVGEKDPAELLEENRRRNERSISGDSE